MKVFHQFHYSVFSVHLTRLFQPSEPQLKPFLGLTCPFSAWFGHDGSFEEVGAEDGLFQLDASHAQESHRERLQLVTSFGHENHAMRRQISATFLCSLLWGKLICKEQDKVDQ